MIIITNKGLVDPMAFHLIGASTKRTDEKTIGFFGSGLKYAMAGLLRSNIPFQVWRGEEMLDITTEDVELRGQPFKRIVINGQPTSFTTDLGPKWQPWMLVRELYANAVDEGGEMAVTDDYAQFIQPDRTTIILPEVTPELQAVLDEQDILFCRNREVLYEDDSIKVYDQVGDGGHYVKGVLVGRKGPGFGYELKKMPYDLNEERELRSPLTAQSDTLSAIFGINDPLMVRRIVSNSKLPGTLERAMVRNGYLMSFRGRESAPAWHKYLFVPLSKEEFATEPTSLVVSEDVYSHIKHPNRWQQATWVRVDKGTALLEEALAVLENIVPGCVPKGNWSFGVPPEKSLFMSMSDGENFISNAHIGEPVNRLAAIIAVHFSADNSELGVRLFHNLINR